MTSSLQPLPLVTIVMYHYVRPLATSAFPRLAALDVDAFRGQLDYVRRHYSPIRLSELVAAARGLRTLPERPVLLTFDDGYSDHYRHVFPLLAERKVPAAFFLVRSALVDRTVLDANKIQFILASVEDVAPVIAEMERAIEAAQDPAVRPLAEYRAKYAVASRFDEPNVMYVKRMLQHALPDWVRRPIVEELFDRIVSADEQRFAADLYFTTEHAREMRDAGMEFGAHADRHIPLPLLGPDEQAREIDGALCALDAVGVSRHQFAYSYAKGEYDATSVELLRSRGCAVALTTRVDLARLLEGELLTLPRINTNELPTDAAAPPAPWTRRVLI